MAIAFIGIAAFFSTFLGGLFTLRFKDKLHLIMGFSAGAIISVAFLDLLPEAIELVGDRMGLSQTISIVVLGFFIYMVLDRMLNFHCHEGHCENERHGGGLGAASLCVHSFLDGMAIGLAFQVSTAVGFVLATAVLVHNFSDGVNTVSIILKGGANNRRAFFWLILDAVAPVLGIVSTLFFSLPDFGLGIILAFICGFFLYIGAGELLPESHHSHSTRWTTVMTVLGGLVLYFIINLV